MAKTAPIPLQVSFLAARETFIAQQPTAAGVAFPSGSAVQFVPQPSGKWTEHMLHSFQDNSDGGEPQSGLVFDSMGNLYGTASGGGKVGNGTFLRLRPTGKSWAFTALYEFAAKPDGAYPSGSLIFDGAGNIYGTTQYGGSGQACGNYGCGTVFRAEPSRDFTTHREFLRVGFSRRRQ